MAKKTHYTEDWYITKFYREIDGKDVPGLIDMKLMYPTGKAKAQIKVSVKLKGKAAEKFSKSYSSKKAAAAPFYSYERSITKLFAFLNRNR